MLLEVRQEAAEFAQGLRRNVDPADGVQSVLDHIASLYEYATQQVFQLDTDEYWRETLAGKTQNEWIKEQERLGLQLVHVAGKAAAMGLAERTVRVQEAQAALFAAVIEKALVSAGLNGDQRREIHQSVALELDEVINGHAVEMGV